MKKLLFVSNSVYQVLIACWVKYHYYFNDSADIIISERMNGAAEIAARLKDTQLFDDVSVLKVKYSENNKINSVLKLTNFNSFAKSYQKKADYDILFTASLDYFIQTLYDFLKRKNKNLLLNYYEDGTASYTKRLENYYVLFKKPTNLKNVSHNNFLKKYTIYDSFNDYFVFNPDYLEWFPNGVNLVKIDKIDIKDDVFKNTVNHIFNYESLEDKYEEKYIFFEESHYADTGYMEDVKLIEELAKSVGKENLIIKIHPRNPKNRFKDLGYKTNVNTALPWEVIAMNIDLKDKKLIAIASTSIINPIQILGIDVKSYSLIRCLSQIPPLLNSALSQTVVNLFNAYPNNIVLCNDIKDVITE